MLDVDLQFPDPLLERRLPLLAVLLLGREVPPQRRVLRLDLLLSLEQIVPLGLQLLYMVLELDLRQILILCSEPQ